MGKNKYLWLSEVITRLNFVYQDEFELVPGGVTEETTEKHGLCQKVTYKFVFKEGAHELLPVEDGDRLMRLIKQAAKLAKADKDLVPTKIKGKHDWCDWAWLPDGTAEMWIFLKSEKQKK